MLMSHQAARHYAGRDAPRSPAGSVRNCALHGTERNILRKQGPKITRAWRSAERPSTSPAAFARRLCRQAEVLSAGRHAPGSLKIGPMEKGSGRGGNPVLRARQTRSGGRLARSARSLCRQYGRVLSARENATEMPARGDGTLTSFGSGAYRK